ncbi:MAG: hypothetical protein IIC09_01090, partial [Proteobacteria bacterium]|nr:hypothetical protein [Pseudomonadota bacterium]
LLDMNGAVIGVNTQIRSDSRQNSGVGFAVPVDLVKRVIPSLIEDGHHEYSLMGITGDEVGIQLRSDAGLPGDVMGAYVVRVTPGGPADRAGIQAKMMMVANAPGKQIGPGELDKALKIIAAGGDVDYQGATNVEFNDVGEVFGTYKEVEVGNGMWNTIKIH